MTIQNALDQIKAKTLYQSLKTGKTVNGVKLANLRIKVGSITFVYPNDKS